MRRIAIINQKGGVGKTTTTVNVGMALARAGHRVLMIDLDPQAHLSLHLGADPAEGGEGTYELLTGATSIAKCRRKAGNNLWLVASSIDLAGAEVELVSVVGREVLLRDLLDQHVGAGIPGRTPPYDFVLMDCPPSLSVLTLNGLCAAREVLIPLQPHYLALQGLGKLLETVSLVARRINPGLKVAGVGICMYEAGTKLAAEVVQDVRSFFDEARGTEQPWADARVFETFIRRNIKLAEAPSYGRSIFDYAADSNGARDYERLAAEIAGEPLTGKSADVEVTPATSLEVEMPSSPQGAAEPALPGDEVATTSEDPSATTEPAVPQPEEASPPQDEPWPAAISA